MEYKHGAEHDAAVVDHRRHTSSNRPARTQPGDEGRSVDRHHADLCHRLLSRTFRRSDSGISGWAPKLAQIASQFPLCGLAGIRFGMASGDA